MTPYIPQSDREELLKRHRISATVGELTYLLYRTCLEHLGDTKTASFAARSEMIAALECAKLELYRRHIAPYEDGAIQRNGDVG